MLDQNVNEPEKQLISNAREDMFNQLSLMMHHDAITGVESRICLLDYQQRLFDAMYLNDREYKKIVQTVIRDKTGLEPQVIQSFKHMEFDKVVELTAGNDTEQLVVYHNPGQKVFKGLLRINLPTPNYKVQVWLHD